VCKVNGDGRIRFGIKEWAGLCGLMLAVAALANGPYAIHTMNGGIHQTPAAKTKMIKEILAEERRLWQAELSHERELFQTLIRSHAVSPGHKMAVDRWLDHERRIAKIEP